VPRLEGEVSRYLAQDITEWSQEYRVTNRSGETRWMQDWNRVIKDAAGTVTHIQSLVVDATTRKHAESVLERTQRTLRVLSECGHALLRRSSEQELLNEACRIAVEVGGYRMAWIGYAEHDARKSIRPMAMVRIAKSHLVRMPLTWADTRYGRGPSGVAIRTGQPCLCGDVSRDPLLAPWRREALKRGCASILALPLSTERGCLGQLTICSGQPDAFDDPECQLLQQLANDLSFGIMALRGRVERKELERQVLDISESVQRRIGQDLHDGLGQSIIGIGYLISAVQEALADKSVPEAAELKRVSKLIWKTVQDMRDMARGLFPGELMSGRVTDALRELARHTQDLYGTACHFTGPTSIRLSDANLASQVYRIAQEAVNNAAKHSKTKAIRVGLSQERGSMVLTVRDTGVGFSAKADNAAGLGQRIMRYRADLIGAALKIESIPGQGTTVTCVLPADRAGIEEMTL
jgi:signal transduction histidine kinase